MKRIKAFNIISWSLGFVVLLTIMLPLIKIIFSTNPDILKETFFDKEVMGSILLTIKASFFATFFGIIFGVPLAYVLARGSFRGKEIIESIIDIPVIIPHSAAGIALLSVFGKRFFVGKIFSKIGIEFVGTQWGIILAMVFVSIPFLVNGAKEGFKLINPRLEYVAMSLGAKKHRAFFDITLPLALKSIVSGVLMMWARGLSEFGAVIILAYHPMVVSINIFERFEAYGLKYARPVAVLLILICLSIFIGLRIFLNRKTS